MTGYMSLLLPTNQQSIATPHIAVGLAKISLKILPLGGGWLEGKTRF